MVLSGTHKNLTKENDKCQAQKPNDRKVNKKLTEDYAFKRRKADKLIIGKS